MTDDRPAEPRRPEGFRRFGERIVDRGFATVAQVAQALRVQAERNAQGRVQNLGEILVEQGVLTVDQVKLLLEEGQQVIMACPSCGERYNVLRAASDRATCPADGNRLALSSQAAGVGIAATLRDEITVDDAPVGLEFGRCRIIEFLGKGGMGAVYKAKHLSLKRYVAVKMIPSGSKDPTFIRRLILEAQTIARLEHPNIVQVYDVGTEKGYFFMVMQFLRGVTLQERLKMYGRPPLPEALEIVRDVARGLEAAHREGIIHRDVKPSNIFVTEDGRARLTDFGLALMTESKDELGGYVVGTPGFMSPEQWQGQAVDGRSDLYSLGIVFYLLATGCRAFEGETPTAVRESQLKGRPRAPRSIDPDISDGLQAVLAKMMARSPEKRYPDVSAFLEDLDLVIRGEDPAALVETGRFIKCGFCESVNKSKATKCEVCGESLSAGPQKLDLALRADEFSCRGCGAVNTRGARACSGCLKRFCPSCGDRPLAPKTPCACGWTPPRK